MKKIIFFLSIIIMLGCSSQIDKIKILHNKIFDFGIGNEAENIKMERDISQVGKENYTIIQYSLSQRGIEELLSKKRNGYSSWTNLGEIYVGNRLFSNANMKQALISEKIKKNKDYTYIIVDLAAGTVYALHWTH